MNLKFFNNKKIASIVIISQFLACGGRICLAQGGVGIKSRSTYIYPNGDKYMGQWQNGKKHGIGIYYYSDSRTYQGRWRNGKRHGRGTFTMSDGTKYSGVWQNGVIVGEVTCIYNNGNRYSGGWKNGMRHGQGTYIYHKSSKWFGNEYTGQWKNDMMDGYGVYSYADGAKYEGQWRNNKQHGVGTYYFTDGNKYQGQWKNDFRHGQGSLTYANGDKYTGIWINDKMPGRVVISWKKLSQASAYYIYKRQTPDSLPEEVGIATKSYLVDRNVSANVMYFYTVKAKTGDKLIEIRKTVTGQYSKKNAQFYFRSMVPGWGQFYSGSTGKGYIFSTGFAVSSVLLGWSVFNRSSKRNEYDNTSIAAQAGEKWNNFQKANSIMWGMTGLFGVIYILNWLDTIFIQEDYFETANSFALANDLSGAIGLNVFDAYNAYNEKRLTLSINIKF